MDKKTPASAGMGIIKASAPLATCEFFQSLADREGVTVQSLVAPVLNAYARGEIRRDFTMSVEPQPDPHGNAKRRP
jgi:hypothetical protein